MYGIVIKNLARVPAADTFLARRVSGPDLMSSYFYTLDRNFALFMLQVWWWLAILLIYKAKIEDVELDAYEAFTVKEIYSSEHNYTRLYGDVFGCFGLNINTNNRQYRDLINRNRELQSKLKTEVGS